MKAKLLSVGVVVATVAAAAGMYWSFYNADPHAGAIWKQVLASSVSYGMFLLVMTIAILMRWKLLRTALAPPPAPREATP